MQIIYFESDNPKRQRLVNKLNKELRKVKSWLDCNKFALNIDKIHLVLFDSLMKKSLALTYLKYGTENIQQTKYVKFLGILVDKQLTWKCHINELSKKLSRTTGIYFKLRQYVPLQTLVCLCNSLFASFPHHGILVWGLTYDTYLNELFILQKKVLRCISFQPFNASSTPLFNSLKLVKLQHLLHLNILTFLYKTMNKFSPACFNCLLYSKLLYSLVWNLSIY